MPDLRGAGRAGTAGRLVIGLTARHFLAAIDARVLVALTEDPARALSWPELCARVGLTSCELRASLLRLALHRSRCCCRRCGS